MESVFFLTGSTACMVMMVFGTWVAGCVILARRLDLAMVGVDGIRNWD